MAYLHGGEVRISILQRQRHFDYHRRPGDLYSAHSDVMRDQDAAQAESGRVAEEGSID